MNLMKNLLNFWILNVGENKELIGFSEITEEANIGLNTNKGNVIPLFIFENSTGWGDQEKTSVDLSWVLFAKGNDDFSVYMLFEEKSDAVEFAFEYINGSKVLDPWKDMYKNKKWNWQN